MNIIVKEFYVFGLLKELKCPNVVRMDDYYLSLSNPVIVMELMDGDLTQWCNNMVQNKILTDVEFDNQWLSMIFQVTYGLLFLNHLNILHSDAKPKNILYSDQDLDPYRYTINTNTYLVPMTNQFKIADFGAVQILGSSSNKLTDFEITDRINKRDDLHELSRIIYRLIVDRAITYYTWNHINDLLKHNPTYQKYHDQQKQELSKLTKLPQKIRDNMLLRSMIYYAVENEIIHQDDIIKRHSLRLPSSNVTRILDNLTNLTIKNVFDLFTMFKQS